MKILTGRLNHSYVSTSCLDFFVQGTSLTYAFLLGVYPGALCSGGIDPAQFILLMLALSEHLRSCVDIADGTGIGQELGKVSDAILSLSGKVVSQYQSRDLMCEEPYEL